MPDAIPARSCGSGGGPGQRCRRPGAGGLLGGLRGTCENVPGAVQCPAVCARHTSGTCLQPGTSMVSDSAARAREPPTSRGEERLGDRLPSSRAGTPGRTVGSRTTVATPPRASQTRVRAPRGQVTTYGVRPRSRDTALCPRLATEPRGRPGPENTGSKARKTPTRPRPHGTRPRGRLHKMVAARSRQPARAHAPSASRPARAEVA